MHKIITQVATAYNTLNATLLAPLLANDFV